MKYDPDLLPFWERQAGGPITEKLAYWALLDRIRVLEEKLCHLLDTTYLGPRGTLQADKLCDELGAVLMRAGFSRVRQYRAISEASPVVYRSQFVELEDGEFDWGDHHTPVRFAGWLGDGGRRVLPHLPAR